jgi:hypothetical protein
MIKFVNYIFVIIFYLNKIFKFTNYIFIIIFNLNKISNLIILDKKIEI